MTPGSELLSTVQCCGNEQWMLGEQYQSVLKCQKEYQMFLVLIQKYNEPYVQLMHDSTPACEHVISLTVRDEWTYILRHKIRFHPELGMCSAAGQITRESQIRSNIWMTLLWQKAICWCNCLKKAAKCYIREAWIAFSRHCALNHTA